MTLLSTLLLGLGLMLMLVACFSWGGWKKSFKDILPYVVLGVLAIIGAKSTANDATLAAGVGFLLSAIMWACAWIVRTTRQRRG